MSENQNKTIDELLVLTAVTAEWIFDFTNVPDMPTKAGTKTLVNRLVTICKDRLSLVTDAQDKRFIEYIIEKLEE